MTAKKPIKIIFDTDIGGDCDDAGALAMLHNLCDRGEAELLAVTACYASPYVAGCIDAINRYYGRIVPVGINYTRGSGEKGTYCEQLCREFPNDYPPEGYKNFPDTLDILRKTLSAAEDASVTLVVTGYLSSLARLVTSSPDEYSPLTGRELITRKVVRTVIMGGRFAATWPMELSPGNMVPAEWNIKCDIPAAQTVCDNWPGELVFSSYEIGLYCISMKTFARDARTDNPVRRAYELHPAGRTGRESWDHTAMLEAIRPDTYWFLHPYGRITVDDGGITRWQEDNTARHTYLIPKVDYDTVTATIDELVGR